ncbi:MAG: dipeptidase [Syntrophomonadaceae bacterium]|nr:dipeptidase [Syntrophomonadaceae bacterium]MDD3022366.1 dipeptidase [Syntrophomonadaceae bacterium]
MKIVDMHCDTISAIYEKKEKILVNSGHFDIKRALQAKIKVQVFALFTMPAEANNALRQILKQLDKFNHEMENNFEQLYQIHKYSDIENIANQQKIGCLLHLEGGEALGTDPEILRILYKLGLRSLGLTWNNRNHLADGLYEGDKAGGLSLKGREIIAELNRLGIILDLSHLAEKGFYEAFEYYKYPIMVSHANARALCKHWRNLDDQQLKILACNKGVVGVNQVADFVKEGKKSTLDDLIDHIIYIADLIGIEHVGLGSDFDGADNIVLTGVQGYIGLEKQLLKRGFSPKEADMVLGENALRVIKAVIDNKEMPDGL